MTTLSLRTVIAGIPTGSVRGRVGRRTLVVLLVVLVLLLATGVTLLVAHGPAKRTVTAYFSQAVSLYPGTDVDIMGVPVGTVKSIEPEGSRVKVVMQYDGKYQLPADVKAAIVTPTLIADRFVQLAPAYTGGTAFADGGTIPMARTAVPVEMDQIYKSLADLTTTLGPHGADKKGALGRLLHTSAKALRGNGQLGNELIANLADATTTLGNDAGPLFKTLDGLASISETLNQNDAEVQTFLTRLSGVSSELSGEGGDLKQALNAIAKAIVVTRGFVHDNKTKIVNDVTSLNTTLGVLAKDQKTLGNVLQLAPLGLGNLALAWDAKTGTEGIRLQVGPTASDLSNVLCDVIINAKIPAASTLCSLFDALIPSQLTTDVGAGLTSYSLPPGTVPGSGSSGSSGSSASSGSGSSGSPSAPPATGLGALVGALQGLLGGGK